MSSSDRIVDAADIIAAFVATTLLLTPLAVVNFLSVAPTVSEVSSHAVYQQVWQWVSSIRITDWLLVAVGIVQALLFGRQTKIADRQADIARRAHIAAHRPKIIVRGVELLPMDANDLKLGFQIRYLLVNTGGSKARITHGKFRARVWARDFPPFVIDTSQAVWRQDEGGLNPGESKQFLLKAPLSITEFNRVSDSLTADSLASDSLVDKIVSPCDFVFSGSLLYVDDCDTSRRTSVWRVLRTQPLRMALVNDCEYEYAD